MNTVVKIEGIGKKYIIRHNRPAHYGMLREVVSNKIRTIGKNIRHPLSFGRVKSESEEFWALNNINIDIQQGDRLGIIGRNGAGKSTLLKILSRITRPTTGRIKIRGRVSSLLEVGTGFHPELTGRENILLNGAILGMSRKEMKTRMDEIIDFAQIEKFLDTPVKRYSSGMYVRLAFSVAAHLDTDIMIVDEVLAVGDSAFQSKCLGKMSDFTNSGKTLLFVSHNMRVIQRLCSKATLLDGGECIQYGSVDEVIKTYMVMGKTLHAGDNLTDIKRHTGFGHKVRISKCIIRDSQNQAINQLKYGEPLSVEVQFVARETIKNIDVVVGINTANEDRITTILSDLTIEAKKNACLSAVVNIQEFILNPGPYNITISIRQLNTGVDKLENICPFTVDEIAHNEILKQRKIVNYGFVQVPVLKWTLREM